VKYQEPQIPYEITYFKRYVNTKKLFKDKMNIKISTMLLDLLKPYFKNPYKEK